MVKENWLKAMDEEIDSLSRNETWKLVSRPEGQKLIGSKWVYKRNEGIPSIEPAIFKARLVAKGFIKREGIDYYKVFSPVVKHTSIRVILAMVTHFDMELEQINVKTAFLRGKLDEMIYMRQPEGYVIKRHKDKVCLLKKSLYSLKQSPQQWYKSLMNSC